MSYCRFSEADVYIYDHIQYGLYCCYCSISPTSKQYNAFFEEEVESYGDFIAGRDYDKMIAHIADHRAAGDFIPDYVDEYLIEDRDAENKKNI